MKTALHLSALLIVYLGYAQSPINNFFSSAMSEYVVVSGTIDESPAGNNAVWNFSSLSQTGTTNTDTFAAPLTTELVNYPNTNQVLKITDNAMNINQVFYNVTGNTLSLTGASNAQFTINYNTDNALVGTYPLVFGNPTTTDPIAGTLSVQSITPSFTGTINSEVDAFGTLTFNVIGQGSYSGGITRIKTEQSIVFSVLGSPGTGSITSYNYYKDSDGALVFRTTNALVSLPALGVNQVINTKEALLTNTLAVEEKPLKSKVMLLYPNPVKDNLNIKLNPTTSIQSIKVMDVNGKLVLDTKIDNQNINLSQLKSGFYFLTITTDLGSMTRKFIKD